MPCLHSDSGEQTRRCVVEVTLRPSIVTVFATPTRDKFVDRMQSRCVLFLVRFSFSALKPTPACGIEPCAAAERRSIHSSTVVIPRQTHHHAALAAAGRAAPLPLRRPLLRRRDRRRACARAVAGCRPVRTPAAAQRARSSAQ